MSLRSQEIGPGGEGKKCVGGGGYLLQFDTRIEGKGEVNGSK